MSKRFDLMEKKKMVIVTSVEKNTLELDFCEYKTNKQKNSEK